MYTSFETSFFIAFLVFAGARSGAAAQDTCYIKSNNLIVQNNRSPCGSPSNSTFLSCCGTDDQCLPNGLCSTKERKNSLAAGFYVGGCTDPSLQDAFCNPACGDLSKNSVVYNTTANDWQCCGLTNGVVNCSSPTSESFAAPAPANLQATFTIGAGAANNTSPATSDSSSGGGLSARAKAGIAVAVIVVGLAILGAIAFLFCRHRKQKQLAIAAAKDTEMSEQGQDEQRERMASVASLGVPPSYTSPTGSNPSNPVFDPHSAFPEKPTGRLELHGSSARVEAPDDTALLEAPNDTARVELPVPHSRSELPG